MGGATLKIRTSDGLEKASCGVEPRKRASLQGFESPSPHQPDRRREGYVSGCHFMNTLAMFDRISCI
jgi:hypothetical protein